MLGCILMNLPKDAIPWLKVCPLELIDDAPLPGRLAEHGGFVVAGTVLHSAPLAKALTC